MEKKYGSILLLFVRGICNLKFIYYFHGCDGVIDGRNENSHERTGKAV
jgi:hypothetical protein